MLAWGGVCDGRGATYVEAEIPRPLSAAEDVVEALFCAG